MKITAPMLVAALVISLASSPAAAEVVQLSASGFATRDVRTVKAPAEKIWAALMHPENWWNGDHSWSGDSANMSLDPAAGGCFCERIPASDSAATGSVEHMRVVSAMPGQQLRMVGALGPLQGEGLAGTLTIELKPGEGGTEIAWSYVVGGFARFPLEQVAPAVDRVISEQLARLAGFVGTGEPAG